MARQEGRDRHTASGTEPTSASQRFGLVWPIFLSAFPLLILQYFLPLYVKGLGVRTTTIGALVALCSIAMTVTRPAIGWSIDRFGPKRFLIGGLLCYAGSMGVFALASTLSILSLAQLIRGVAGALTWVTSYTLATHIAASGKRGETLGRTDSAAHQGGLVGLVALLALLHWQPLATVWRPLCIGLAALAAIGAGLAWWHAPSRPVPPSRHTTSRRLFSWPVMKVLTIVLIIRGTAALTKPLLFIYLHDTFATDSQTLLLLYLPAGLIDCFLPTYVGRVSDQVGRISLLVIGMVVSGIAAVSLPHLPQLGWFVLFAVVKACGVNTADPTHRALLGDHLGFEERGTGFGLAEFVGSLAAAIMPPLGGWLYETIGPSTPWYVSGSLLCVGAVWGLVFLREHPRPVIAEGNR